MRIFISGGCKNGKSHYAQRLAKAQTQGELYYIATMLSTGHEDDERIARHIKEREGWGFTTVEQPRDIGAIFPRFSTDATFLLDSTTALLANEMFPPDGSVNAGAADKICIELEQILTRVRRIVIVSDYIFSDAQQYDPLSEQYRRALAQIDRTVAALCDTVLEVAYSTVTIHKEGACTDDVDIRRCISGQA